MIHSCKFCEGKVSDVSTRNHNTEIYCVRCGERLKEEMVEENMLKRIKRERENGKKFNKKSKRKS